jgi:hypothetical protein
MEGVRNFVKNIVKSGKDNKEKKVNINKKKMYKYILVNPNVNIVLLHYFLIKKYNNLNINRITITKYNIIVKNG